MLDKIFLSVLNMSITASFVILGVLLFRFLLKKAPKIFSYALWAIVLFRLICPISFESAFGLLPINETPIPQDIVYSVEPQINTGLRIVDDVVNPMLPIPDNKGGSINPLQAWAFAGSVIWVIGITAMLIYSIIQFVRLKRKLIGATPLRHNIYLADHTNSPFVMGFIKPKIYLPSSMAVSEQAFIIAHEQCHIKRLDHIARILAFIALTIHWFNPLVWLAFVLSGKDMEMSCDETVMKKMGTDIRAEYSQSLLRFATDKKFIAATPLAFGEGDTKDRVKNVMKYKKPMLWVSVIAIIAVICVAVGLMSNPKANLPTEDFNDMIVGAELPYLLYANNDYCIMNMWHGGVIVYDFNTQEISDRITFEKLEGAGFSYPIPMVSEDGQIIYFREDSQTSKQPYTYSYNLQTKELNEQNDDVKDVIHSESIYENQLTQTLLSDGLAYGGTMIKFDDIFIVSRIKAGGSLLSDTEIVFLNEALNTEKTFHLRSEKTETEIVRLWKNRTEYVGDNAAVGNILSELKFPEKLKYNGFQLFTEQQPYAITVNFTTDTETRNFYTGALNQTPFKQNAIILFSLIENVEIVNFNLDDSKNPYSESFYRESAQATMQNENLFAATETLEGFSGFIKEISNKLNDGTDIQTNAQSNKTYSTEADFLNHPDGVKFQAVAYKAAKAYLNGDSEELAACISENCTVDMRLDLFKDIDYMILKWSLDDIKAEDKIHAAYEFKLKGEDSVSFVSMELIKIDNEWKVDFIAIEK